MATGALLVATGKHIADDDHCGTVDQRARTPDHAGGEQRNIRDRIPGARCGTV